MSKKLKLGIFGFGVVGQGLHDIIRTKALNFEIVKFAIKIRIRNAPCLPNCLQLIGT